MADFAVIQAKSRKCDGRPTRRALSLKQRTSMSVSVDLSAQVGKDRTATPTADLIVPSRKRCLNPGDEKEKLSQQHVGAVRCESPSSLEEVRRDGFNFFRHCFMPSEGPIDQEKARRVGGNSHITILTTSEIALERQQRTLKNR